MTNRIDQFRGDYLFLSNFFYLPDGKTIEHYFQAGKTLDRAEKKRIVDLSRPQDAKRAGRAVTLRPDWDSFKFDLMYQLIYLKFTKYAELRAKLLATGDAELIEGNHWHDNIWGSCFHCGPGENHLGKTLMTVRRELEAIL